MKSCVRFFSLFSFLLSLSLSALGQTSANTPTSQQAAPLPVFHAQSKMVIVDVVVADKSGKPATGLRAADFQLSENGTPQTLRVFEEHSVAPKTPKATLPTLPANQYSNFPVDPATDSVNLLLFDMLNTPPEDQQWARKQMLLALQKLPSGQQVALFVLGRSLQMIQGVSGDSDTLIKAATAMVPGPASLTESFLQHQAEVDRNRSSVGGPTLAGDNYLESGLSMAMVQVDNAASDQRVRTTLQAMEAIGRTTSAYPGRKNLIWIGGGIPLWILPNRGLPEARSFADQRNYTREIAIASFLLADSQIAVYPVDVRGLATAGLTAADRAVGAGDNAAGVAWDNHEYQTTTIWGSRDAMKYLAAKTGGRAFTGSNDLSAAIDQSMAEGSHYYTLGYVPTNIKSDGLYRNIKVTSDRSGLELSYRRGYFATSDAAPSGDEAAKLLAASLQPGLPPSTSILMRVQVLPPDASHKTVRMDYSVASDDVQIQETPDHVKHITLDFMAVAWDNQSRVAASASDTLSAALNPNNS
jgi:VWFA-related protein